MELVAKQACVSSQLVYRYFPSRMELLQALYQREYERYQLAILDGLRQAAEFPDAVRVFVEANFQEYGLGNVLNTLNGQPDIRAVIKGKSNRRARQSKNYVIDGLMSAYGLSRPVAEHLTVLGSSASVQSAEHYKQQGGDRSEMVERTVRFIVAGLEAVVASE